MEKRTKLNLLDGFRKSFQNKSHKAAISFKEQKFSYQKIENLSGKIANALLKLGLQKGDRLISYCEKSPFNLFIYLACLRTGVIYLPLNISYTHDELSYFINDAKPALIVCEPKEQEKICRLIQDTSCQIKMIDENGQGTFDWQNQSADHEIEKTNADDTAVMIYTSGTTGKSKGAMITHENLLSNAKNLIELWEISESDVLLHMLPLFHVHGLFFAFNTLFLTGGSILLESKFDLGAFFSKLKKSTVFMGVPTHYTRLLSDERLTSENCANMRLFISGSAPLLQETFKAFSSRTHHEIVERYGMTETGVNTSNPLKGVCKFDTVGLPLGNTKVRIVDENDHLIEDGKVGHIQVKGDNVFKGYWGKLDQQSDYFTSDGYFKTGDLGKFDEEGYLSIIGRSKDLIITGGLNVYPKEIELSLNSIAGIRESAVIGVNHPDFGEAVVAVVSSSNNQLNEEDLITALKKNHAGFKCPKKIFFVDELPKNTMGKVQKNLLRVKYQNIF